MKRKCRALAGLMMCMVLLVSCAQPEPPAEIVIGAAWPFGVDSTGQFEKGIDLAVLELNAAEGIGGREIRLLKKDDGSEVVKGLAAARELVENRDVLAVIGHQNSYISIPASAVYEQGGVTMLSPASTAPELTQNGYRFVFRNIPSDDEIAKRLVEYAAGQGLRRMVIYYSGDSYGTGLAESLEDQAAAQGMEIVDRTSFYAGEQELRRLFERWQAFQFDGVFLASSVAEGVQFILDAKAVGISCPFLAGNTFDSAQLTAVGGMAVEGMIVGSVFDPGSDKEKVRRFVAAFQDAYGEIPGSRAALGYDAVNMLAAAVERSGGQSREEVAAALRTLGVWTGVCGVHELSDTGDDQGDLVMIKQVRNGSLVAG